MKKTTFNQTSRIAFVLLILVTFLASCDKIKDIASTTVSIKPSPIVFTVGKTTRSNSITNVTRGVSETNIVLFKTMLNTRLNHYLQENGFSYENVRAFDLIKAEVKSVNPIGYDMSGFVGMKLYLGTSQDLVAEAKSVSSDKKILTLQISVANTNKYIKTDNLPILLKGPNPVVGDDIQLSMQLEFEAKVTPL